ncbi:MAG: 23S rRNA (pseudouridine(1915)-N(3))-methyltransferase RlmH [Candidatus Stygibacter australis]|nr:23S rRNA (pseudouridine(1915)-N(3))-methyltransferase RlmH [Candidatus Stygibacter australis]MDP8320983.1 23S rRNA (pseudouridine(1915)-N(3))-methyltransferase RlmH [Candidatus Stygibacter australis]
MSVSILAIGKTKQDYLIQGIDEFQKRLSRYTAVKLIELPDIKTKKSTEEELKFKEAELLLRNIKPNDILIALDERGKMLSSKAFSEFLEKQMRRDLVFCIGGVHGLDKSILTRADFVLSFSRFTFTHQMIRLLLFEQIYRALNILQGGQYHK